MKQPVQNVKKEKELVNLKEASEWGSQYLNRRVTISNISYLLQYGRIKKYLSAKTQAGGNNGTPLINLKELQDYYDSFDKEKQWKEKLGEDIDWHLSFIEYKESREEYIQ